MNRNCRFSWAPLVLISILLGSSCSGNNVIDESNTEPSKIVTGVIDSEGTALSAGTAIAVDESNRDQPEFAADADMGDVEAKSNIALDSTVRVDGSEAAFIWLANTGLKSDQDSTAWTERVNRACAAPIWEAPSAEMLAEIFIAEDGGDPYSQSPLYDGLDQRGAAIWTLWTLAHSNRGCLHLFPMSATFVENWLNQTGLRGPYDLSIWAERVERACDIVESASKAWRDLAIEFVEADLGDPNDPALVDRAVEALQIMARGPGVCS